MSLVLPILLVALATGVAVGAMLLVRRRAPDGSYFADSDRAAGVFGVITTGFSVLLGFVIFLAFTSYDDTKQGAEVEALVVAQQFETAQFMPSAQRQALSDGLVCYAAYVVNREWPMLEDGTLDNSFNPWGVALFQTITSVEPQAASEQSAYDTWLGQTSAREEARRDRVHGAVGVIPTPIWVVLFLIGGVIFAYMLFFADSGERAVVQAMLMGSVVSVITLLFLLLATLDNPFHGGVGGLEPIAMERTLGIIDEALTAIDVSVTIPCDEDGARATP